MKGTSRFSKYYRDSGKRAWNALVKRLVRARSAQEVERVLQSVVSASEKQIIVKRILVKGLLAGGATYKEVSELLWVSPMSISALRKSLISRDGYQTRYERAKTKKKFRKMERISRREIDEGKDILKEIFKELLKGQPAQMSGQYKRLSRI